MKKLLRGALALAAAASLLMSGAAAYTAPGFSDLPRGHWAYNYVMTLADAGVAEGTGGGRFSPEEALSAASFLTFAGRALFPQDTGEDSGKWWRAYYEAALELELITEEELPEAEVEQEISRSEMARIVVRIDESLRGNPPVETEEGAVPDIDEIAPEYREYVAQAYAKGLLKGENDGKFNGSASLTRAAGAAVVFRLMGLVEDWDEYKPLAGAVIGVDAGHQAKADGSMESIAPGSNEMKLKNTVGTQGIVTKVPEYVVNLDVAVLLKQYLEELGAEVVMSRESHDVNTSNIERAVMMNERNVDLLIRIHCNSYTDSTLRGAMMLVPEKEYFPGVKEESAAAGSIVLKSFLEVTGAKNLGVIPRRDLTGFNWSEVPVILIEMGFMSNPAEDRLLASAEYQALCARGLAEGVAEWWESLS